MTRTIRKILVATDFSECGDAALSAAMEVAEALRASVELVHVAELFTQDFPYGLNFYQVDQGGYRAYVDLELARRAERVSAAGLSCSTRVIDGRPAVEIISRAKTMAADLIVLGTHGRKGVAHAMMGSVAERVVQRSPCAVLAVPLPSQVG